MNVLIAEDEFTTADAIQRLVSQMGHSTDWACTGSEALCALEDHDCELVILSAQLRDADIAQFLPTLRARHPELPVVALTAHNNDALERQVRQLGVICYLIKPLDIDELGSIVSHVSRKRV